jgi:hypothetical protein
LPNRMSTPPSVIVKSGPPREPPAGAMITTMLGTKGRRDRAKWFCIQ